MKSHISSLLVIVLLSLLLDACSQISPVDPNSSEVARNVCSPPESDNKNVWALGSCVTVSTTVYTVRVRISDDINNHTTISGSGSSFGTSNYSGSSFRLWQDGKGILPVFVVAISPEFHNLQQESGYILLKTSDLKAMALPISATATFICNEDVEVLSPNQNSQVLTTDRLTYELDDCRMTTPAFLPEPIEKDGTK